MANAKHETREQWLKAAIEEVRPLFAAALKDLEFPGYDKKPALPSLKILAVGVVPLNKRVNGTCWPAAASVDEKTSPIGICASLKDPVEIIKTLIHELCHATVGNDQKHNAVFGKLARALDLAGKLTATTVSEELKITLKPIIKRLGIYPHVAFNKIIVDKAPPPGKVRNVTFKSVTGGYEKYRAAIRRDHWNEYGAPCDPDGIEMVPVRAK